MSEEERSITRPHPEAIKIAREVSALLKSEDTGEYRKEVLLKLNNIENTQSHHGEILKSHMKEDKEEFDKHGNRLDKIEVWQNRIIGVLGFLLATASVIMWAIDKFGGSVK